MLVFIDESGYPIPTDSSTKSVVLAVCIKETDMREITHLFYRAKSDIYGHQNEIKSTELIRPKTILRNWTNNKAYAERVLDILDSFDTKVFAVVMDRPIFKPYVADGMLPIQYHRLLQRIQAYCDSNRTLMAMCVFDETDDGRDKKYAVGFNNFLYRSAEGQACSKILVSPFFVSSSVTPSIELADICAGIVRKYYQSELHLRGASDPYEEWLIALYRRVLAHSCDVRLQNGRFSPGIYQLPLSSFRQGSESTP